MSLHDDIKILIEIGRYIKGVLIIISILLALLVSWIVVEPIWEKIFGIR